jgi:rubrerythrin
MSPTKKTPRKTSKKSAPKKPAKSRSSARPAAKPAAKKAAPKPAKTPKKKAAAPPPPAKPAPAPKAARPAPQKEERKVAKAVKAVKGSKAKPRSRAPVLPDIVKPGLGGRWECFRCGAKFYDLGRPEPTCPKCGADQRDKPREKAQPPTPPPERPRKAVPMGSLLEDEEEPAEEYEGDEEDLAGLDEDSFLTETPESAEDEDEVDVRVLDDE